MNRFDYIFNFDEELGYGSFSGYPHTDKSDSYLLEVLINRLPLSTKILDLGCNVGNNLIPLSTVGYALYGVDILEDHISLLKSKISSLNTKIEPNIELWDVFGSSPFPWINLEKQINAMFATYFFGHCDNKVFKKTIEKLTPYLSKGGVFGLTNMTMFDMPLEDWEKKLPSFTLGIYPRTENFVDEVFFENGYKKLSESRPFLTGEMQFWPLPEHNYSWLFYELDS